MLISPGMAQDSQSLMAAWEAYAPKWTPSVKNNRIRQYFFQADIPFPQVAYPVIHTYPSSDFPAPP